MKINSACLILFNFEIQEDEIKVYNNISNTICMVLTDDQSIDH